VIHAEPMEKFIENRNGINRTFYGRYMLPCTVLERKILINITATIDDFDTKYTVSRVMVYILRENVP